MEKWILIIEDDKVQCEILCKHLQMRNISAHCAHSWAEGVAMSHAETFDLGIVDLQLPDSNQMQTVMRLHELNVPSVIAMTGMEDTGLVRHCTRNKIPLVFKPISTREFLKDVLEELERLSPSEELEKAILKTKTLPLEVIEETTNGKRVKRWLASNAVALAIAMFVVTDHFGGWLGVFRGGAIDEWELRSQVNMNTKAVAEERAARAELATDLRNIHSENEVSKSERKILAGEIQEIHAQVNNIYTALMKK